MAFEKECGGWERVGEKRCEMGVKRKDPALGVWGRRQDCFPKGPRRSQEALTVGHSPVGFALPCTLPGTQ